VLQISAFSNYDGSAAIVAERTGRNTVRVNSYSRFTDIRVERGQRIHVQASGRVTLGLMVGAAGPTGLNGFDMYRRDAAFPLGSLIGRIGDGPWVLIGADATITAAQGGTLQLLVNDNDLGNNEGAFDVTYTIDGGGGS
jgi:hypothetical protein